MSNQQHLIPEVIINLAEQYKKSTQANEKYSLEARLQETVNYINSVLKTSNNSTKKWGK